MVLAGYSNVSCQCLEPFAICLHHGKGYGAGGAFLEVSDDAGFSSVCTPYDCAGVTIGEAWWVHITGRR